MQYIVSPLRGEGQQGGVTTSTPQTYYVIHLLTVAAMAASPNTVSFEATSRGNPGTLSFTQRIAYGGRTIMPGFSRTWMEQKLTDENQMDLQGVSPSRSQARAELLMDSCTLHKARSCGLSDRLKMRRCRFAHGRTRGQEFSVCPSR